MNKKILLTSIFALGFAGPAVAVDFPTDGVMTTNQEYANAAKEENWGIGKVEDGDIVYADAIYELIDYVINPGYYLPQSSVESAVCPANSYCPGGSFNYSATEDQEVYACSSLAGGYSSSDSGSITSAQCYKTCATTAKAGSMTGRDYYGYGMSTCEPASCVKGWTLKSGKTESTNLDSAVGNQKGFFRAYTIDNGSYVKSFDSNTYTEDSRANGEYVMDSAAFYDMDSKPGEWAVEYGYLHGAVRGMARLSEVAGTAASGSDNPSLKTTENLGAERGSYCYCNVTGYRPYSNIGEPEKDKWRLVTSLWAYAGANASSLGGCATTCAGAMAGTDSNLLVYRSSLLGSVTNVSVPATCAANKITIVWNAIIDATVQTADNKAMSNFDEATHSARSSVEYDNSIYTPKSAMPIAGKRFKGWSFRTTPPAEQQ